MKKCWAEENAPAGKRLAPILAELVPVLRRWGKLAIDEGTAALLVGMSTATIDRRLAPARSHLVLMGLDFEDAWRGHPDRTRKSTTPIYDPAG